MALDKQSCVPLYYQLADQLREDLKKSEFNPNEPLPSENELMSKYNISRGTIREAMRILIRDGLVERRRGIGTFVVPPKIDHATDGITSFSRVMLQTGRRPSAKVLKLETIPAPYHISENLQIPKNTNVVLIKRLRYANGESLMIERSYYREKVGKNLYNEDLTGSIYTMWKTKYNYHLVRSEKTLEVISVESQDAKLLNIPKNSPVVILKRLVFFDHNLPVEYAEDIYRSDRTVFKFKTIEHVEDKSQSELFY